MEKSEEDILKRLILDEKETLEKLETMVSKAETLFKFDLKSKIPVLSDEAKTILNVKQRICVLLVAQYFGANKIKIAPEEYLFNNEALSANHLAKLLGKKITSISGRLTELGREGKIEKDKNGHYRIVHHMIENVLFELTRK